MGFHQYFKISFCTNSLDFRFRSLHALHIQNMSNSCSQFHESFKSHYWRVFAIYPNFAPALGCWYCIRVCARTLQLLDAFLDSILKEEFQRKAAKFSLQLHIMYCRVAEHYILEQGHAQAEFSFFSPREIGVKNCAHYLYLGKAKTYISFHLPLFNR